jgi:hypothetical protein
LIVIMNPPETNDPLPAILAGWQVVPRRDPRFRGATWARIQAPRGDGSWWAYARGHRILTLCAAALALVAGGWVGREQARTRDAVDRAALAEHYVRSLDARTMRMP